MSPTTKYLVTEEIPKPGETVTIGPHKFEKVSEFTYLGSVTQDNNPDIEIRITAANKRYFRLRKQLNRRILSRQTKLHLYKTLVRPVLLYGSEYWTTSKATGKELLIFEKKVL